MGRGVENLDRYLRLERHGRRRALPGPTRRRIWQVFTDYMAESNPGTQDEVVARACAVLEASPLSVSFDAIVVDEAQDLTETALRMLMLMLADGRHGRLLLVGDGMQRIYPGGYRLTDLGIDIRGRSHVLRTAYRSTTGILAALGAIGRLVSTEEFGAEGLGGVPTTAVRPGPPPELVACATADDERAEVARRLTNLPPDERASTAVLLPTNSAARNWRRWLRDHGLTTLLLEDYEGIPKPGIKIGTYARAKGLEFATVVLPGVNSDFPSNSIDEDEFYGQCAQFYVAVGRARDHVVVTHCGAPSMLLENAMAGMARGVADAA